MNSDEIITALRSSLSTPQRGYYWRQVVANAIDCVARLERIENDVEAMDGDVVKKDDVLRIIGGAK